MKNFKVFIYVFLLMCGLSAAAKEYKYQTVKGDLMNTRIYTLDNGLTVYLSVNNEKPRIQTYIAVRTGSRNDPPETTGLAHYLEHIMFKGTRNFGTINAAKEAVLLDSIQNRFEVYRTLKDSLQRRAYYQQIDSLSQLAAKYFIPNEYDKLMSSIGAEGTNAYTSNDVTCYVEDIPANELENWAKIESDRFQNMVIRGIQHQPRKRQPQAVCSLKRHALPRTSLRHTDHYRYTGAPEESVNSKHQELLQPLLCA